MSADQLTVAATSVMAIATVVGVAIAAFGLKTWRTQLEGSARFDLARRLLLEVYRFRDAMEGVRHPIMMVNEVTVTDPNVPWEIAAYESRWQKVVDIQSRLQVCTYECQILWDQPITELTSELRKQTVALYGALTAFARTKQGKGGDETLSQEQRDLLYSFGGEDRFSAELQAIIERFETYLRPHLPRPS